MDGLFAQGRGLAPDAAGVFCRVAGPGDDAELRTLLRDHPMAGWVSVATTREPSYFSPLIAGEEHQTIIARDEKTNEAVGMCARTVRPAYIDGEIRPLGYIGELRIAERYRHRFRIIRQGFDTLRRELHEPERTPYYLTAILSDNKSARRLLEADLPSKPTYHPICDFVTLAFRTCVAGVSDDVAPTAACDVARIAACLQRNHARYQFAPAWSEGDLREAAERGGPGTTDFIVQRCDDRIEGCLAIWDQSPVRQALVCGYHPWIARLRPIWNLVGAVTGRPRLPAVGETLRHVYLSLAAVDHDDPEIICRLVRAALVRAGRRGFDLAIIGMAMSNPMLPALRRSFRAVEYHSRLYLVHWQGDPGMPHKATAIPHIEVGFL